jgi:hypothetical protein
MSLQKNSHFRLHAQQIDVQKPQKLVTSMMSKHNFQKFILFERIVALTKVKFSSLQVGTAEYNFHYLLEIMQQVNLLA